MEPLAALHPDSVLELAQEGGVAFMPKLNGLRRIELGQLNDEARGHLCELINGLLPFAQKPEDAGRGDQRYFRLVVQGKLELRVPESKLPKGLLELWKAGGR
ncbi:protealysin inhibitor emfourin [Pseudomonas sp. HR96]|uniref:protealysin inhibitor emfourin n=1 Tax=Pseudomonas sp. HR96 TaxID=1027966 RepID=UPI002A755A75|nr:protealysin inhibitor emfourin [Pseudomonas sp. HR96]WPP01345.1 protealysin inhibitor emfourin [Pseudomonas sp. HR96]